MYLTVIVFSINVTDKYLVVSLVDIVRVYVWILILPNTNTHLLMYCSLLYIQKHSHTVQHLKYIKELQFQYMKSVLTQKLTLNFLNSQQRTPLTHCKVSVTMIENSITIRYIHHWEISLMPTFAIRTISFLIGDHTFTLTLPEETSLLEDRTSRKYHKLTISNWLK